MTAFIDLKRGDYGVEPICDALGVSASAYYQRKTGKRSARRLEDERLLVKIRKVFAENYECYGVRRMHLALRRDGVECPGFDGDRVCRFLILMLVVVSYRTSETTPEGSYTLVAFRVSSAGGGQDGSGWGPFRACHSASCSTGGRLLIELCSRRVLNHATYSMIASSSWLLVRHTRSRISSVLNVSTKLSAIALAIAVNCAQCER